MGLTWLFGFFSIEDAEFFFSLIFCLCNSFQGIVIFVLFCARQEDVQSVLRPYYNRVWCIRVCLSSQRKESSLPSGKAPAGKSPYSDDQFAFQPASSAFDFESTTQATIVSEIEPESTVPDANDNGAQKETGIKVLKVPLLDMGENLEDQQTDDWLKDANEDDAIKESDSDKDDKAKHQEAGKPTEQKRRIFSIYEVFVNYVRGEHEEPSTQQATSGNRQDITDGKDGLNEKDPKSNFHPLVSGNNLEKSDRNDDTNEIHDGDKEDDSTSEDEDMLVAPIEIENTIKDAHVEIDND